MAQEILSFAIYEPVAGQEAASLATMRDLVSVLTERGYSRDELYRDGKGQYVLFRWWASEAARQAAHDDPDVLHCWAKLGNEIRVIKVCEKLDEVNLK
jgi:heme-degrading monooxygenase HmoA